jgi:hypothetical protein
MLSARHDSTTVIPSLRTNGRRWRSLPAAMPPPPHFAGFVMRCFRSRSPTSAVPRSIARCSSLADLTEARRGRIDLVPGLLPPLIDTVLVVGALLTLTFTLLFAGRDFHIQILMTSMLCFIRSFGTSAELPAFAAPHAVGLTSIRRGLRRPVVRRAGPNKPATGADYEILGEALAETAQKSHHPCEVRTSSAGEIYTAE